MKCTSIFTVFKNSPVASCELHITDLTFSRVRKHATTAVINLILIVVTILATTFSRKHKNDVGNSRRGDAALRTSAEWTIYILFPVICFSNLKLNIWFDCHGLNRDNFEFKGDEIVIGWATTLKVGHRHSCRNRNYLLRRIITALKINRVEL